jgi:hypothetical protein
MDQCNGSVLSCIFLFFLTRVQPEFGSSDERQIELSDALPQSFASDVARGSHIRPRNSPRLERPETHVPSISKWEKSCHRRVSLPLFSKSEIDVGVQE